MNILLRCLVIGSAFLFLGLSDDPNEKADELYAQAAQLVESAKQAGSYLEALPLYEQARDLLERIVSQYADSTVAVGLVSGQTKISNVTLSEFRELGDSFRRYAKAEQDPLPCALIVAGTVKREYLRIEAAVDIARVFVKAGQAKQATLALSQALDLANAIHAIADEYTKAEALVDIANEFVELGQPEKASPLLSQALDIANTYPRWEEAIWVAAECNEEPGCGDFEPRSATVTLFTDIARGLVKAGQAKQAESLLLQAFNLSDGIHWGFIRHSDVANIARGLVGAGQVTQALDIAKTVRGENAAGVLAAIARDLTKAGQVTQALDLVNALTEESQKSLALGAVVDELAETGQPEQVRSTLALLLDPADTLKEKEYHRASLLVAIARDLTKAGQVTQALDVANTITGENEKSLALAAVARELTRAGQVTQALDIANTITGENEKVSTLVDIARELAKAGQPEQAGSTLAQALDVANIIKWEPQKVSALVAIARELTRAEQPEQAGSTLAQALDVANAITGGKRESLDLGRYCVRVGQSRATRAGRINPRPSP